MLYNGFIISNKFEMLNPYKPMQAISFPFLIFESTINKTKKSFTKVVA
jgi:hypothetical protein